MTSNNGFNNGEDSGHENTELAKLMHKLHQLEVGQRKIIHLLTNLDRELGAKEKLSGSHCARHSSGSLKIGHYLHDFA